MGITYHERDQLTSSAHCFEESTSLNGRCSFGMLMWGSPPALSPDFRPFPTERACSCNIPSRPVLLEIKEGKKLAFSFHSK